MEPASNTTNSAVTETTPQEAPAFEPITSQEQLNAILADRLRRERAKYSDHAELKAKAARLDEIEQAAKSDLEKATETNAALTAELEALKLTQLRSEIAVAKGLDPQAARFLTGTSREQIEADADDLVKLTGDARKTTTPTSRLAGQAPRSGPDAEERAFVQSLSQFF